MAEAKYEPMGYEALHRAIESGGRGVVELTDLCKISGVVRESERVGVQAFYLQLLGNLGGKPGLIPAHFRPSDDNPDAMESLLKATERVGADVKIMGMYKPGFFFSVEALAVMGEPGAPWKVTADYRARKR